MLTGAPMPKDSEPLSFLDWVTIAVVILLLELIIRYG